ncbi:shikimate kinase I [Solemya pervernicosa gill symbiont]|uniref:Shikimate kinase n=2 Tax=Solemya pervernicosa gill symbiont TaxID=642797 RepID=A0A1T2LB95_9GAMM|nr:shikimate kinase I [Solemya pervernicosa gill symbiont]
MGITFNTYLVGPMGAGKSTIGKQLSKSLNVEFLDSDNEIIKRTGADIPLIFELEGEAGFRKRESAVIADLTDKCPILMATGGGAVLSPENRENLRNTGFVIYLKTSVNQQLRRTSRDKNRPLLQTEDPRKKLEELMATRDPLYREVADLIIETDGKHVKNVVKAIISELPEAFQR